MSSLNIFLTLPFSLSLSFSLFYLSRLLESLCVEISAWLQEDAKEAMHRLLSAVPESFSRDQIRQIVRDHLLIGKCVVHNLFG